MGDATALRSSYWNANGLACSRDELALFAAQYELDVILVNETHLEPQQKDPKIPGYLLYRYDRPSGPGGGTAIYVSRTISHCVTPLNIVSLEAIAITIPTNRGPITLASCYNPPDSRLDTDDLLSVLNSGKSVIAAGDLNSKNTSWGCRKTNTNGRILQKFVDKLDNCQVIAPNEPTHYPYQDHLPDILDIVVAKNLAYHISLTSVNDLSSDHNPVLLEIDNIQFDLTVSKPLLNLGNFHFYLRDNFPEIPIINCPDDLDNAVKTMQESIQNAIARNSFTTKNEHGKPALPGHILSLIKTKNEARKTYRRTRLPGDKTLTNRLTNAVKRAIVNHRSEQWQSRLSSLNVQDNSLWRMSKVLRHSAPRLAPIHGTRGLVFTDSEKVEAFADSLEDQCRPSLKHADLDHVERTERWVNGMLRANDDSDPITPTTLEEVQAIIKTLNVKKAPGPDQIPNRAIKVLPTNVILFLTAIFNAMFALKYFPKDWKTANVIFIPKPGKDHKFPQNHRPISLLSTVGKLAEKLILRRLSAVIDSLKLLPDEQFGFRQAHSTTQQIVRLTEFAASGLHIKHFTGFISLDVEKAFDSVWHKGLLCKLLKQGVPLNIVKLLRSFLSNRTFRAKINNTLSGSRPIEAGVPQGSVLSPTLFSLFTADLPTSEDRRVKLAMYADDTAIVAQSRSPILVTSLLQQAADKLETFFRKWLISVNAEKSSALLITRRRSYQRPPKVTMFGQDIPWKDTLKYLGVTFDQRLTFSPHVSLTLSKTRKVFGMLLPLLNRNSRMSARNKLIIYKMILRPTLTYASPAWAQAPITQIRKLQLFQNKCLRLVFNAPQFVRTVPLHQEADNTPMIMDYLIKVSSKFFSDAAEHDNALVREATAYDPTFQWKVKRPMSILI